MNEPEFLSRDEVEAIHREQLDLFGGQDGILDSGRLDAAIGSARSVFDIYAGADIYDLAAAYAFSISEGQPFVDGNKRTGLNAALAFLDMNDARLPRDDAGQLYLVMMRVAKGRMTRAMLADVLRALAA